jgi:hypothetical protein
LVVVHFAGGTIPTFTTAADEIPVCTSVYCPAASVIVVTSPESNAPLRLRST